MPRERGKRRGVRLLARRDPILNGEERHRSFSESSLEREASERRLSAGSLEREADERRLSAGSLEREEGERELEPCAGVSHRRSDEIQLTGRSSNTLASLSTSPRVLSRSSMQPSQTGPTWSPLCRQPTAPTPVSSPQRMQGPFSCFSHTMEKSLIGRYLTTFGGHHGRGPDRLDRLQSPGRLDDSFAILEAADGGSAFLPCVQDAVHYQL